MSSLEPSIKVVTAYEMARIEKLSLAKGGSERTFMETAGKAVAEIIDEFVLESELDKIVTLLIGKGNNGGDAYAAGAHLVKKGFSVTAYPLYSLDKCSALCQEMHERFVKAGGNLASQLCPEGIIVDGLVGTGFHGGAKAELAEAIQIANDSHLPIIAIDIPSGLDGNTGAVETVAIEADITIYLELPKLGFFIGKGWDHVGQLVQASFGLESEWISQANAEAYLFEHEQVHSCLPLIKRSRHKYEAGYVLGVAGSLGMPGAAILSSYAALRSGAGIVRLFHPAEMEEELNAAPYELIRETLDLDRIREESKRAKSAFVGPGIGRSKEAKKNLKSILLNLTIPCVIDADALFFVGENPSWRLPAISVLTPHRGEMERLLARKDKKTPFELSDVQAYVEKMQVTVVLKGAPTFIFHPGLKPVIVTAGDPGMATAGAGDVLTGVIAALLAQGMGPVEGASVAVALHGIAGELAALDLSSYSLTASDLIDYLPAAFL